MVLQREDIPPLVPLLDLLAAHLPDPPPTVDCRQVARIRGGQNNLLFQATTADISIAIKFTRRDARDRAGREFTAENNLDTLLLISVLS